MTIEVQVLGALRLVEGDQPLDLGGPRQRRLLGALVLADGAPVSVDRLVEAVFGDAASPNAPDTLRSYVTRLRRVLSPAGADVVVREGSGYRLASDVVGVDADRFADHVAFARRSLDQGDRIDAAGRLREALALWRGDAYEDLADEPWVAPEARRLDEARRSAQELLAETLIATGRGADAIGVLRGVLEVDPYREGAVGRLMLALYRSGRPADALQTYREFAERLADDLGIDPGPALQGMHEQVLARDPGLDSTTAVASLRGYELGERLGRGRHGTVYAARMPGVERDYAVRVYDAETADDRTTVASFEADVRLLATLDEPALLPVYDGWREPGSAALVMRRMPTTLADVLARGPLSTTQARDVVETTGRALVALARRGRVHGRVRASSVLLDEAGQPYLCEPEPPGSSDHAPDAQQFVRLARECVGDQPPGWLDDLDDPAADTVEVVSTVLARLDATPLRPENPFVGLRPFEAADSDRYFGREHVVADLADRVPAQRLVLVVGGSGSGKSSIVRAGLLPRLRGMQPSWTATVMVPGSRPFEHLAQALRRVSTAGARLGLAGAATQAAGRFVLVVDQLEELFTLADEGDRERFLATLADVAAGHAGDVRIVATVRADFFDQVLQHPRFGHVAAASALPVPPMGPADLERTIRGPAQGRLDVDDGLVGELVSSVAGQPGALPALQFTLRELAERGGTALRRDDLVELGGVAGAIARRAEQMYAAMPAEHQQTLRRVLQSLVVIDESGEPARRTVARSALAALGDNVDEVVDSWVDGRLLSTGRRPDSRQPTVTLAHEAVLSQWPRLRDWVDEDREHVLALARLEQAAQEWVTLGRDAAALPRGGRLERAERLAAAPAASEVVREFVERAVALRDEEQARADEAAAAKERTTRRLRRQRWLLAAALVVAIGVGWVAIDQRGAAVTAAQQQLAQAEAGASSLVTASNQAALSDWSHALLLAVEAHRVSPSPDTERNLLATLVQPRPVPTTVWTSTESLRAVVVDPVSPWAAVQWAGGPLDVIDLEQGRRIRGVQARGPAGFDLHGGTLVFAEAPAEGARVRVLDDTGDRAVADLPDGAEVTDVEISPDGDQVAIADSSGEVRLLDTRSWEQTRTLAGEPAVAVQQVAWAESAQSLYAFDAAGAYLRWDLGDPPDAQAPAPPTVRRAVPARVAWGRLEDVPADLGVFDLQALPDQQMLSVMSTRDGPFWVDVETSELSYSPFVLVGGGSPLGGAVTDGGGQLVVSGSSMQVSRPSGDPFALRSTVVDWNAVDVDVRTDDSAVTVGSDGNVTTWSLPDPGDLPGAERAPALDGATGVVLASDGGSLLRWDDTSAQVLDAATYVPAGSLDLGPPDAVLLGAAWVPETERLVTHVCRTMPEREWEPCDSVLTAFSTDGSVVAGPVDAGPARPDVTSSVAAAAGLVVTVDATATATVRDPRTLEAVETVRAPDAPDDPQRVILSLSPGGRLLAVSTEQPASVAGWRLDDEAVLLVDEVAGISVIDAFDGYPEAHGGFALSDDVLLVATFDAIRTYGPQGGEPRDVFAEPFKRGDVFASEAAHRSALSQGIVGVNSAASSTGDSSLVLTGEPGSYWLWDARRAQIAAGPIAVDNAVLDPRGDRLFVWPNGDEAFVMSLRPDDMVAAACAAAGRTLTQQEWSRSIGAGEPYEPVCPG
jgi:DNA-binding SARP family transcriptional activator/WD40 repeat protein/energy-coupling factor transporter ATP-binding protein EcfA2